MVFQISINDFYPRSPCGERPHSFMLFCASFDISIHALLAESDVMVIKQGEYMGISIHALLAESDSSTTYIV